jgi:hypothetical protein
LANRQDRIRTNRGETGKNMIEGMNHQGLKIFGRGGIQENGVEGLGPQERRQTVVNIDA